MDIFVPKKHKGSRAIETVTQIQPSLEFSNEVKKMSSGIKFTALIYRFELSFVQRKWKMIAENR